LLPRTLLSLSTRVVGGTIVPHYLTERDHPWLHAVLDEYARFVGRKSTEFLDRMREPLPVAAPRAKLRVVCHLLEALARDPTSAAVPPREARWLAFRAAATRPLDREAALADAAAALGVTPVELETALFADCRSERRVSALPHDLGPARLASETNLSIVSSLIRRALTVRIAAWGNTRALVRQAHLSGLICRVERAREVPVALRASGFDVVSSGDFVEGIELEVSGPFALFRHTEVYGRALASLVPRAAWCDRFEIVADCVLGRGTVTTRFVVRSGDPIGSGRELPRHDSRLEARFEREFRRAAPVWDVVREPRPVEADGSLIFPDFELVHRHDADRRWLLEIVGFWTPDYLENKLRRLRAAGIQRLVICIDERRRCSEADLPRDACLVRYRSRIDPAAVLAIIDARTAAPGVGG
jgi:predicted nuclease of restriction endonuclease-like RecB superfamily